MEKKPAKAGNDLKHSQKALVREIDELIRRFGLSHKTIAELENDAISPVLKTIKVHYIRGEIIDDYTLIDELLGSIVCKYFFDSKKGFIKLWRTKKFKLFNYYILEKLYLGQKLDLVKNIIKIESDIESKIRKINDLRNAYAHALFPENLRGKKRHLYNGKDILSREGLDGYMKEKEEVVDYLFKKAYQIDVSGLDFRANRT